MQNNANFGLVEFPEIAVDVQHLNVSGNQIEHVDLFRYSQLLTLNVSFNPLRKIVGESGLQSLLASNTLLNSVPKLKNLQTLSLARCGLSDLTGLGDLPELTFLDLARNKLDSLQGMQTWLRLLTLQLQGNPIMERVQLTKLTGALLSYAPQLELFNGAKPQQVNADPLLALVLANPGCKVVQTESSFIQGQLVGHDVYLLQKTLRKVQKIPLGCFDLVADVNPEQQAISLYSVEAAPPSVSRFAITGKANIGDVLRIEVETNFSEYSLRLYSVGLGNRTLVSKNQFEYVVADSDAGNYLMAELETPQGIHRCQTETVKLVTLDYFQPKFVYWRDEDAVLDAGGWLGVFVKEDPRTVQLKISWAMGTQDIGCGQFIQLNRFLGGKRLRCSIRAAFLPRDGPVSQQYQHIVEEDVGDVEIDIPVFSTVKDMELQFIQFGQLEEGETISADLDLNCRRAAEWFYIPDFHSLLSSYDLYPQLIYDLQNSFNYRGDRQHQDLLVKHYTRDIQFTLRFLSSQEQLRLQKFVTGTLLCCIYDGKAISFSPKVVRPMTPVCKEVEIRAVENEVICLYEYEGGRMGLTRFCWEINEEEVVSTNQPQISLVELADRYTEKLSSERYSTLKSETYNIKMRQVLLSKMSLRVSVRPVRFDGIFGQVVQSAPMDFTDLILREDFDPEWPEYKKLLQFKQQIIAVQALIDKCDPTCQDSADIQLIIYLNELLADAKENPDSLIQKLNPDLVQALCTREKLTVFDQLQIQTVDYVQIFGSGQFFIPKGHLSAGKAIQLDFNSTAQLKLQTQFGFVAVRQCAVDRELTQFEQQIVTLMARLLNQPPELITLLSSQYQYKFQRLDIGCAVYCYYVDDTFRMSYEGIQVLQFKNKVHFSPDFQLQQLQITPFNAPGQPVEINVIGTDIGIMAIKWSFSQHALHPNSTKWQLGAEQCLSFTPPTNALFCKTVVEIPDTQADRLFQLIVMLKLTDLQEPTQMEASLHSMGTLQQGSTQRASLLQRRTSMDDFIEKRQTQKQSEELPYTGRAVELMHIKTTFYSESQPVSVRFFRAFHGKYFHRVGDAVAVQEQSTQDCWSFVYTVSPFDAGFEILAFVTMENDSVQILSVCHRQCVQMGHALRQRLRIRMAQPFSRMQCYFLQRVSEVVLTRHSVEVIQGGIVVVHLGMAELLAYQAGTKQVRLTNGQQKLQLDFEDEEDALLVYHATQIWNNASFYDAQLCLQRMEMGDQYVLSLRQPVQEPTNVIRPYWQEYDQDNTQQRTYQVVRNLFRTEEGKVVTESEEYEIQPYDLGQIMSVRIPGEQYDVPVAQIHPQQSNKLLYRIDQLNTIPCLYEQAPAQLDLVQVTSDLESVKCRRGMEVFFELSLVETSLGVDGLTLILIGGGESYEVQFTSEQDLEEAFIRLSWSSGHCGLKLVV